MGSTHCYIYVFLNSSAAMLVVRMGCLVCLDLLAVMSRLHSHIRHPLGNLSSSHFFFGGEG